MKRKTFFLKRKKKNIFICLVVLCKIHLKKYFRCLDLHVKHFPEKLSKPYLIQANPSKNKSIATNNKLLLLPQLNHVKKKKKKKLYEQPHKILDLEGKERRWVLREKKGERCVDGGGLVRTMDGLVRTRDGSMEVGR